QANASREQQLFLRFKAEEASQSITAKRRMISPEDNNERQQIHDHETVPLGVAAKPSAPSQITQGAKSSTAKPQPKAQPVAQPAAQAKSAADRTVANLRIP